MLLYAEHTTARLQYILDFISSEFFIQPIVLTNSLSEFSASNQPKINYSDQVVPGAFRITPVSLLFETGIRSHEITCFDFGKYKAFFATGGGDFPFDIFSASFYLLSRYEEYVAVDGSEAQVFNYEDSLACRNDFLDVPLVNIWLKALKACLQEKFPEMFFTYRRFKFIPTYNIEKAYAHTNRGWRRNMVKDLRMIMKGDWTTVKERKAVFEGRKTDPFDAYEWLDALHLYCRLKPHYFFMLQSNTDSNTHAPAGKALQQLISYYASAYKIGVHLSPDTVIEGNKLREEIELLEYLAGKEIVHSRFATVRLNLPGFYRSLISRGITKDHSMGYRRRNGFRASVASSFFWYDLATEETTALQLFPFCFTDSTAFYEQRLSAPHAFQELMHFYTLIKSVNGLMITTWHNQFLGNDPAFKEWKDVYEIFLKDEVYWDN